MVARSTQIDVPPISLPNAIGSFSLLSPNSFEAISSFKKTFSRSAFGSSIPMTERPGTVEILAERADIERAMSSESPMTLLALSPGAGINS